jgi:N-acyl-D-amino-acid deacylase
MYEIVIKNGMIVDGSGNPWFKGDVGIQDGKIVEISRRGIPDGKRTIDATGMVVAPGFCDLHTHSDFSIMWHNHARSSIHAGVTTEAVGQCGTGAYAFKDGYQPTIVMDIVPYAQTNPANLKIDWRRLSEWGAIVEGKGTGINIAPYVAHGTVRNSVMGVEGKGGERYDPTPEEMEQMKGLVREAMDDGAFGLSTGLRYPWGRNSYTEEVIDLCKVVKEYGGIYISHMRSEEDALIEAARETIRICEEAKVPGSMTHHKAVFEENWGKTTETMRLIDRARARGVDIMCDFYPWEHAAEGNLGQLFIGSILTPEMDFDQIMEALGNIPGLIQNPDTWKKIKKDAIEGFEKETTANEERKKVLAKRGITAPDLWDPKKFNYIVRSETHPNMEGKNLGEIAQEWGSEDYLEAAKRLYIDDEGGTLCAGGTMSEEDIITILKHPTSAISTDGAAYDSYADLHSPLAWAHPRNYGSFAKVLQRYVREMKLISLEEAIRKMTSLPLGFLGVRDRGYVKEGMWADITIFDPKTVTNKATFQQPCVYPEGINYVMVNGQIALDKGKHTDVLAGKVLKRN